MSRLRTIKPGFFVDEELAECQPLARLLFAGIWTIADREGRLEDRPKRIKVQVLPYDGCDVDQLLGELASHCFIVRYDVDGQRYIAIPTWSKHQSPHIKEPPSTIPAPDMNSAGTVQTPYEPPSSCLGSCLGKNISSSAAADDGFSDFWTTYPRKVGKAEARKRWKRLSVKDRGAVVLATGHLAVYVQQSSPELQYVPHPATFIGPKRTFEDWVAGAPAGYNGNGSGAVKRPACPQCESDLTNDEDGEHCPVCDWRAT